MLPPRLLLLIGLVFLLQSPSGARANRESNWGAVEHFTRKGHFRYLILLPNGFDRRHHYELWVNIHGSPGCASHAIFQYREEAATHHAILLAPEATEGAGEFYTREDGKGGEYHLFDMKRDPEHVLNVLDEVLADVKIDRQHIALLGFSAGCEMGWRLIAKRPEQFYFFGGVANRFKNGRLPAPESKLRCAAKHVAHFYGVGKSDDFAGPWFNLTATRLRQFGFSLRTVNPPGVGHALPPLIKRPLIDYLDAVRRKLGSANVLRIHVQEPVRSA